MVSYGRARVKDQQLEKSEAVNNINPDSFLQILRSRLFAKSR